jgi:class 3 adenylate cyclase/tetratricopeptide (TPR) repeat protein
MAACPRCGADPPAGARFCPSCGAALVVSPEIRKTVTVLFCDWVGSTPLGERLDPESLRRVQTAFFTDAKAVLERHGGTVEKFIGDAVMAVFGMPQAREDDALRAVRAAAELREALAALNGRLEQERGVRLSVRTGVNTGEVVAGDPSARQAFVTGDAVNVAKRLEGAAAPGEILIGVETQRLVRDAAMVEPVEDLVLKGKSEPVSAWRLLAVVKGAPAFARRFEGPLVGRDDELAALRRAFRRAAADQTGYLFTVLGVAGVGKSRLLHELLAEVGASATVLRGHCLPYGDGITFWPLSDIVRTAAAIDRTVPPDVAREQIAKLLEGDPESERVVERLAGAMGLDDRPVGAEETFWAARRLLEALARKRPVVVVFDDLHWAEPTFLDLVEHLGDRARDAPIVIVCLARPELLELRPTWAGGKVNATTMLLEPLSLEESQILIRNLLREIEPNPEQSRAIAEAADGNPLFLEEILAMMLDEGALDDDDAARGGLAAIPVPPTIQAVLTARLDRLADDERTALEAAAVMGTFFRRRSLEEMLADADLGSRLGALVRKELIRPDQDSSDGAFRFRHVLIHDAAYNRIPKERRGELHERFADLLERQFAGRLGEIEELIGYHLERASALYADLHPGDDRIRRLGERAGTLLASAGDRALAREDVPAAINLLDRAAQLLEADPGRLSSVLLDLGTALREGGDLTRADAVLARATEVAGAAGRQNLRWRAVVERSSLAAYLDPDVRADDLLRVAGEAVSVFEQSGDELGLASAFLHVAEVHWMRCQCGKMEEALERAIVHADRAGSPRERSWALGSLCRAALLGPRSVEAAIERCDRTRSRSRGDPVVAAYADSCTAVLEAMRGRPDEARELYERTQRTLEDIGMNVLLASMRIYAGWVELILGEPAFAARELQVGYDALARIGERAYLSTTAAFLARALQALGKDDDAERLTRVSEESASRDDIGSQVIWRGTRARVLAARGDEDAVDLASTAVALSRGTDFVNVQADALVDFAATMQALARHDEALRALGAASQLYSSKGNVVSATAVEPLLAELEAPSRS